MIMDIHTLNKRVEELEMEIRRMNIAIAFATSVIGVLIFVGLTAYDTQKLKTMYYQVGLAGDMAKKLAINGALNLYMDFINLFIYMLRFFGNRRD